MTGCGGSSGRPKVTVDALAPADSVVNKTGGRDALTVEPIVPDAGAVAVEDAATIVPSAEAGSVDRAPIVYLDANVIGSVADVPNADQPSMVYLDAGNATEDAPGSADASLASSADATSSDEASAVRMDAALPDVVGGVNPSVDAGLADQAPIVCTGAGMMLCGASGCVDTQTNASNCGYCGIGCNAAHSVGVCGNSRCAVSICAEGWGDCDGYQANGCETDLSSAQNSCGHCSLACQSLESCVKGVCECSGNKLGYCNGVCTDLGNDERNCGACGTKCGWGCASGACVYPVDIVARDRITCALMSDQTLYCWGQVDFNNNCYGTNTKNSSVPVKMAGIANVAQVAVGQRFACVLSTGGSVSCWGISFEGELGDGTGNSSDTPVAVSGLTDVTQLVAGESHVCALRSNGEVWCWGDNEYGATGSYYDLTNAKSGYQLAPHLVNVGAAAQITAGSQHTCALLRDNSVMCWGYNDYGELGQISAADQYGFHTSAEAVKVAGIGAGTIIAVRASFGKTCVLIDTGSVVCWGVMSLIEETYISSQQGDAYPAAVSPYLTPNAVTGAVNMQAISMGDEHICGILNDKTLDCWGCNWSYQVGAGPLPTPGRETWSEVASPLAISGLINVQKIALGHAHSCALLADHSINCWGDANCGALGNGTSSGMVQMATVLVPNAVSH
jgi:alpha-tubulin suppressor-like RCC1 family protein